MFLVFYYVVGADIHTHLFIGTSWCKKTCWHFITRGKYTVQYLKQLALRLIQNIQKHITDIYKMIKTSIPIYIMQMA